MLARRGRCREASCLRGKGPQPASPMAGQPGRKWPDPVTPVGGPWDDFITFLKSTSYRASAEGSTRKLQRFRKICKTPRGVENQVQERKGVVE